MRRPIVLAVVGPTAVGKTSVSIRLARKIGGEIISADSMQVYKGMAILSQAPSPEEKKKIRHHLVNFIDPGKEFSVAEFIKLAAKTIRGIIKRGKIPMVVGGTGLYVKALVSGLFPSPDADLKFRQRMLEYALRHGNRKLHERLGNIDPESAGRIHPNDRRRVIRALEIFHLTGKTMTELKSDTRGIEKDYDVMIFGLNRPRGELYSAVDARVDGMFERGAIREVKRLRERRLSKTAGEVLGYKEIAGYLEGARTKDEAKELLKMNTRRFVKRQLTWFRADKRVKWLDMSKMSGDEVVKKIGASLKSRSKDR